MTGASRNFASIFLAVIFLFGCAPVAFSPHFKDNNLTDLKAAMANVAPQSEDKPRNGSGKPLAFIVTKDPRKILAYDLQSGTILWSEETNVTSKVVVGKNLLFYRTGKKGLEARKISDGQKVWSSELLVGDRLLGLTTNGTDLFYATENTKRSSSGIAAYLVAVAGNSGKKRWLSAAKGRLGAPVARDDRVFLPLRNQSIAIVNAADGTELARIRSKDETLLWARNYAGGMLYGGLNGIYQLDDRSISGTKVGSTFIAPNLPENVRSVYWWDGYNAALSSYTAFDRNRLLWNFEAAQHKFVNNMLIVHNYRFFFAFDTAAMNKEKSGLRWAYSFPREDVVASTLTKDSLILVTVRGDVVFLDPEVGIPVGQNKLKVPVLGVTFDAAGFKPPKRTAKTSDLRQSLTKIIWDPDRRFGMVKLFCVEQLAQIPGGKVAEDLVKIVSYSKVDPAVYKRAGEMIVSRRDKASIPLYLRTLKSHYDFVDGTQSQAVDIMAQALGVLKATDAVRPLLNHLADHETPLPAVKAIVKALFDIGHPSIMEPFRDYLLTYRCDPTFDKVPGILNQVSEALLKLGGEDQRRLLSFIGNDQSTLPSLRTYLKVALKQETKRSEEQGKDKKKRK